MGEMMGEIALVRRRKRKLNRLEPVSLWKKGPGMHADGNGLYLLVQESGSRSWILRTVIRGRRKDIGLGGLSTRSLAEARHEAATLRSRARTGEDVLEKRRIEKKKTNTPTFEDAARIVHRELAPTLKNDLNRDNWLRSLENHVFEVFGRKPVDAIDSADVLRAVGPIWTQTPDMARKTLSRIRRVMDWATIQGFRNVLAGNMTLPLPNPCSGIQVALPRQPKDGQHAALAYHEVPDFILKLRQSSASTAVMLAIEFAILTAARTSEVLEAAWKEFDVDARIWMIPAERMKMDEAHQVPLSDRCVEILVAAKKIGGDPHVFPSTKLNTPLSNVAMLKALQRMKGYERLTIHGFRSAFKTWAHEKTKYDTLVIEACLAHKVGGIERHYLRTTFLEQRRKLMKDWTRFVTAAPITKIARIGYE